MTDQADNIQHKIEAFATELGITDAGCAATLMLINGMRKSGFFKDEQDYIESIKHVEEKYSVSVIDKMPKFKENVI